MTVLNKFNVGYYRLEVSRYTYSESFDSFSQKRSLYLETY